jgi:hypothetical protein
LQPLNEDPPVHGEQARSQIAALPWRRGQQGLEIMLVSSRQTKRWVIPKGWPMKGRKPYAAAAQEAREEEKEGLYIVRAICAAEVDPMRLTERDTKAYCGIILDGNSRKYFMRMYFNATIKKIEIFDNSEPAVVHLESISDLYKHVDRIKHALRLKLA